MKLEFKIEIEIPEADILAEQVYEHIYLNDWYEEDDLETAIMNIVGDYNISADLSKQIPIQYEKLYYRTLNKLKYGN